MIKLQEEVHDQPPNITIKDQTNLSGYEKLLPEGDLRRKVSHILSEIGQQKGVDLISTLNGLVDISLLQKATDDLGRSDFYYLAQDDHNSTRYPVVIVDRNIHLSDGRMATHGRGEPISIKRFEYDKKGQLVRVVETGVGRNITEQSIVSKYEIEYDQNGLKLEEKMIRYHGDGSRDEEYLSFKENKKGAPIRHTNYNSNGSVVDDK